MINTGDRLIRIYRLYSMQLMIGERQAKHVSTQPFLI